MSTDLVRFGDFELDARNYCLRRCGANLKLERIPLELLLLLARRPGELVTREEIIEKLWGKDVYLDTENAINTAIRKVRLTLGDDPSQPRFVQTVTGKGYRFIAGVSSPSSAASRESAEETQFVRAAIPPGRTERDISKLPGAPWKGELKKRWGVAILITGGICVLGLGFVLMRPGRSMLRAQNYVQITNDGQAKQGPLLTDGLRLYFVEGTQNHRIVGQVSALGGDTSVLSTPLETPILMDMAPSRSELLMGYLGAGPDAPGSDNKSASASPNASLWILGIPAGALRRAGDVLADDATWSPDGKEIAYARDNGLYRARNNGSGETKLTTLPGAASWLRWSRDGSRLRLTLFDSKTGRSSLWEVSSDGKQSRALFPGWNQTSSDCCGNWTPDGKYFVFQATHESKTEIWALPERRGLFARGREQPVQMTAGQMDSLAPVISANGKKLYIIGQQLRGELARYDSRAGQFVPYLSGLSAEFVDFSRDGKWVTYVGFPEHTLWRSKIDGSERLQLTMPPVQAAVPRWSPDGKQIAFFDVAPGKPWKIYLISAEGGTPDPLLDEQRNEMDPNWSPDGKSLMFSYFPVFEKAPAESLGVYLVDLRTRNVTKLPGSDGLWVPRWSPDGRHVLARSMDSLALMIFDVHTQTWTELLRGTYFGFTNWSWDGRYVYYLRRGREPAVLRVGIKDRKVEEIASLRDVRQTGFRGAIWTGLTPDDSPLVLLDVGTQEIYSLDLQEQ